MDPYLRFENVSSENLYLNISEVLQSKNYSNCLDISREMTTKFGQLNETEFSKELQVNLCQKHLFLQQLTHNMTKDCSLNYE